MASVSQGFRVQDTPFGPAAILWAPDGDRPGVLRVFLSRPGVPARQRVKAQFPDAVAATCIEIDRVADRILAFLSGEDISFPLEVARLDRCSAFRQRVLRAEHAIPRGCVSTYRRIAGHIGCAGAARAVGTALAGNPFPIIIPCHRAIRSDGSVGGYQGGSRMKRALLRMEGLCFDAAGRVVTAQLFY
jgi:methylated-DNA-[protein]-cysteine S-methyltransferase